MTFWEREKKKGIQSILYNKNPTTSLLFFFNSKYNFENCKVNGYFFLSISFGQIPPMLYHHYEFNSKHNFENCKVDGYSLYLSLPTQYWKFNKQYLLN